MRMQLCHARIRCQFDASYGLSDQVIVVQPMDRVWHETKQSCRLPAAEVLKRFKLLLCIVDLLDFVSIAPYQPNC